MSTLLVRLAAPLQAWGRDSKFDKVRQTGNEPSKSGVTGLLAAALGRDRAAPLDDLAALRFGVRVVRRGRLLCDYHTVSRHPNPRPGLNRTDYVTKRYYLSDAVFIAGFESEDRAHLAELEEALRFPAFPLFLGRRSCPPTPPLSLGITDEKLEDALMHAQCREIAANPDDESVRLLLDADRVTAATPLVQDLPISFSPRRREHGFRAVQEMVTERPEHDPFGELEG